MGFYLVLMGFTGFYWVFTGFLLGFTGFYWVLLGFIELRRAHMAVGNASERRSSLALNSIWSRSRPGRP